MSRREGYPLFDLEQSCIEPGLWMIEGFDVVKVLGGWRVYRDYKAGETNAYSHQCRTLHDAREWISTAVDRGEY